MGGRGKEQAGREGLWLEGRVLQLQWGMGGEPPNTSCGQTHIWGPPTTVLVSFQNWHPVWNGAWGRGCDKTEISCDGPCVNKLKTTPTPNKNGSYGIKGGVHMPYFGGPYAIFSVEIL